MLAYEWAVGLVVLCSPFVLSLLLFCSLSLPLVAANGLLWLSNALCVCVSAVVVWPSIVVEVEQWRQLRSRMVGVCARAANLALVWRLRLCAAMK